MPVVSVSIEAPRRHAVYHLGSGQQLTFGRCGCGGCGFDALLQPADTEPSAPVAGRITAHADHWKLDNYGGQLSVEDLEHPQDLVTVRRGQAAVPIPFELARLTAAAVPVATIFGPEPVPAMERVPGCPALARAPGLDMNATYYAVLLALCEPRLRVSPLAPLPTAAEIARRLRRKGIWLSPGSVSAQIAYLVDKLQLNPATEQRTCTRRNWRKEVLAGVAIRHGLVSADQLHSW